MGENYSSGAQSSVNEVRIDHDAAIKDAGILRTKAETLREIAGDVVVYGDMNFGREKPLWDDELSGVVGRQARNAARHLRDLADSLDEIAEGISKTSRLYKQVQGDTPNMSQ